MLADFAALSVYAPLLLRATWLTIFIAVTSQAIGTGCGLLLALARLSGERWLRIPALLYIWIARGTPALLHLFFIYFALPTIGIRFNPIPAAIIAFSISSSAYNAEILRAGIEAVAAGQIEAARAVGMSRLTVLRVIVLPQAVRVIVAPYVSTFISHVKGTSLASVVTVNELMMTTEMIYNVTFRVMEAIFLAGAIYLALTSCLSLAQLWLERALAVETRPLSRRRRRRLGLDAQVRPALPDKAAAPPRARPADRPVIEVAGITKRFGNEVALEAVSLAVHRGEVVCLLGPSGSGKSTLLRSLNLLEKPDTGAMALHGDGCEFAFTFGARKPIRGADLVRLRTSVGMVFQQFNLWPHKVAIENVTEGLVRVRGLTVAAAADVAAEILSRVGLADKLAAFPDQLSGGQRQRVAIARALAMAPQVMLFDEPTSALDPELVGEVLDVIETVAASGMTIIIATHEMGLARKLADRIVFMDKGRIIEDTTAERFFTTAGHERSERFLSAILR
jgi:polar amino acid transport system permease protein